MTGEAADLLGIGEGFRVWLAGHRDEAARLLSPLSEGVEVFDEDADPLDAAITVADDLSVLADLLDDVLPRLSAVPLVWVCFPSHDLDAEEVAEVVHGHGWGATAPVSLDDTWVAMRLAQD